MKKIKILISIFILFSCFLINTNYVKADEILGGIDKYDYVSAINPFDSGGNPQSTTVTAIIPKLENAAFTIPFFNIEIGASDWDQQTTLIGTYTKYYLFTIMSDIAGKFGWGYDLKNPLSTHNNVYKADGSTVNIFSIAESTRSSNGQDVLKGGARPDYIKVTLTGWTGDALTTSHAYKVESATAADYTKFVQNQKDYVKNKNSFILKFRLCGTKLCDENDKNVINSLCSGQIFNDRTADTLLSPAEGSGSFEDGTQIVFVSTSRKQKYNSKYFDRLKENMKKYSIKHWGEETGNAKYEKAFKNLAQIIDTGEYDTKSYTDLYYKNTKAKMNSFMASYLSSNKTVDSVEAVSKNHFTNWLDLCGRYILEDGDEGVKMWKKYFNFMYADPDSYDSKTGEYTRPRTSTMAYSITLDQDSFDIITNAINDMIGLKNMFDIEDELTKDSCLVYCPPCLEEDSKQACTQCKNSSGNYKTCSSCLKSANEKCKNATEECLNTELDKCLDANIGKDASKYFRESLQKAWDDIEAKKEGYVVDLVKNLEQLDLYDFQDIVWKPYTYEGNCEDVKFLRGVWLVITIGAPFLVIILGSFDYFKNVYVTKSNLELELDPKSYEREWSKNKKKFIRRLVALVLLIVTPILIKIILNHMTPSGSSARNIKLMQCIVNGE